MGTTSSPKILKKFETEIGTLFIRKGISVTQIGELVSFANTDSQVAKFTGDKTRFATKKKATLWINDGKTVYVLSDRKDSLLGIVWFHSLDLPEVNLASKIDKNKYKHTFAIRIYGRARGKGLAERFMRICFSDYKKKGIWLSVSHNNTPAIKVYRKFGFSEVSAPDEKGKVVMIY